MLPKSMLFVKPSPRESSPGTLSMLMRPPRTNFVIPLLLMTAPSSLPIPVAASPRSSEVTVPAPASKSLTVKRSYGRIWIAIKVVHINTKIKTQKKLVFLVLFLYGALKLLHFSLLLLFYTSILLLWAAVLSSDAKKLRGITFRRAIPSVTSVLDWSSHLGFPFLESLLSHP